MDDEPFDGCELEEWMRDLVADVNLPDHRTINWVVDLERGKGKTRLPEWLAWKYPREVFVTRGGKLADLAYEYKGQRIVVMDLPKEKQDYFQYSVLESLKDGYMTSSKYQSVTKWFKPPWCRSSQLGPRTLENCQHIGGILSKLKLLQLLLLAVSLTYR